MSATCPGCGVPVVPGYVRCPKCHRPLAASSKSRAPVGAGGTAVDGAGGGLPLLPIAGGVIVVLGIILYFVFGKSDAARATAPEPEAPIAEEPAVIEPEDSQPTATATAPPPPIVEPTRDNPNRIDPGALAADLERALRNQRLWSSVEVVGQELQLTSGSCRDASMLPTVNAAARALRTAGLTRVRCLENSGAVVFERAL